MGKFHGYHIRRIEDIELLLPYRMQLEPRPGDNPLHRPYPEHAQDMEVLADLLSELNSELIEHKYTERDLRVRVPPHGILFIHALDIKNLVLSKHHFQKGAPFCVYVELECQDTIKCSDPVYSWDLSKVRIDHSVHMFIELSEFRMDNRNEFYIHIYAFQDPEHQHLIGSQKVHMYEFVRDIHGISTLKIINELSYCVGVLSYEFAWAYGAFGYGFSNQLLNSKTDLFENICHSMFPRIKLSPDDLLDNKINARIPKQLRLVTRNSLLLRNANKDAPSSSSAKSKAGYQFQQAFNKLAQKKKQGAGNEYAAKSMVFRRVKYCRGSPIHVSLNLDIHQKFMEDDFNNAYGEYLCLRNRRDRLTWLTKLTEGRLRDKVEFEATELFKPFNDVGEARRVLNMKRPLGAPPSLVEYTDPQVRLKNCQPIQPLTRIAEDDWNPKFVQEQLASAPRQSGYLAYVFGYETAPPVDENLKNIVFKVDPRASKAGGQFLQGGPSLGRRAWLHLVGFLYWCINFVQACYKYVFPTFERLKDKQLPEISVTMPSPEHSTTDFHSFCTQKQILERESDLDKTRRRTKQYIQMVRQGRNPEEEAEDFEEFLIPTEAYIGENRRDHGGGEGDDTKSSSKHNLDSENHPDEETEEITTVKKPRTSKLRNSKWKVAPRGIRFINAAKSKGKGEHQQQHHKK